MTDLGAIALICAVALLGPALTLATGGVVPAVVGELLAGVALGSTGLRAVDPGDASLSLLYTLGFATLMFTVGMRVPLHDARVRTALRGGVLAVLAGVPLALGAGYLAHLAGGGPAVLYATVVLSSSAAVALPVVDENGLGGADVLAAIAWISVADVVATVLVPVTVEPSRAGRAALGAVAVIALVAVVFVLADRLRDVALVKHVRREGKHRLWAIDLRVAVVVLVGLSFVAQKLGASVLVAGFGTGIVVGAIGGPKRLSQEVLGLGQGFLVPVFFVLLGANLDLRALVDDSDAIVLAAVLAAGAIGVHVAAARIVRLPAAVGLLASAQIGVPAAAIALGLAAHTLDRAQAAAMFCAALACVAACAAGAARLR